MRRSTPLWNYLKEKGVTESDDNALISECIKQYRREYKRNWRRTRDRKARNIRLYFTDEQYRQLSERSRLYRMPVTPYAKEVILTAQESRELIPQREALLYILQRISMAASLSGNEIEAANLIKEAEAGLLDYLKNPEMRRHD